MLPVPAMLAASLAFWGAPAPCGTPHVVNGDLSANPGHYDTYTAAWADPRTCTITLDLTALARNGETDQETCVLVTHEDGHLRGLDHDHERDVMNPAAMYGPGIVPQCERITNASPPKRRARHGRPLRRSHRPARHPQRTRRHR